MDASYYFATGQIISSGKSLTEPFLWNYLNDPQALANPLFSYWMPIPGLLAGLSLFVSGSTKFWVARIPFILFASLIPLLCAIFTSKFSQRPVIIWLSAGFGLVSGYYLPYLTITETFTPFFIFGAAFFAVSYRLLEETGSEKKKRWQLILLGGIAGLMHLTRADGILWIFGAFLIALFIENPKKNKILFVLWIKDILWISAVYILVMSGWFIRNLVVYRNLFPVGTNLSFWMTEYNDLFIYPASSLTWERWWNSGLANILALRIQAITTNVGDLVGVVGEIVLFPFILVGIWQLRKKKLIQFSLIMLLGVFCLMSLVFPFAGARGGFFHSTSAFQVLFWSIAAFGFEKSIECLARVRKWKVERAIPLLGATLFACVLVISTIALGTKVLGVGNSQESWEAQRDQFLKIESFLNTSENDLSSGIMVNDSPGYYVSTGRQAIQQTNCDIKSTQEVMQKFGTRYLVIGKEHTSPLGELYKNPGNQSGFILIGEIEGNYIYEYQY